MTKIGGYVVGDLFFDEENKAYFTLIKIEIELVGENEEVTYWMQEHSGDCLDGFDKSDLDEMKLCN